MTISTSLNDFGRDSVVSECTAINPKLIGEFSRERLRFLRLADAQKEVASEASEVPDGN